MYLSTKELLQLDSLEIFNLIKNELDSFYNSCNCIIVSKEDFYEIAKDEIIEIKNELTDTDFDFMNNLFKRLDDDIKKEEKLRKDLNYQIYLTDYKNHPLLSQEEIIELTIKAQNGDKKAKDILVSHNMRLVIIVAKKFIGLGIELDDLIQEGTIGLIEAIDKFDVSKNIRFSTYVMYWIKKELFKSIYSDSRVIKIPIHKQEEILNYKRTFKKLSEELNREPTIDEIAKEMNITYDNCLNLYFIQLDILSLDKKIDEDENEQAVFGDFIESDKNVENESFQNFIKEDIEYALYNSDLTEREIYVIIHKFGLFNNSEMNFAQIGREINLTRERIRQLEKSGLTKLTKSDSGRKLIYYLYEKLDKSKINVEIEEDNKFNIPSKIINYFIECGLNSLEIEVLSYSTGLINNELLSLKEISEKINKSYSFVLKSLTIATSKLRNNPIRDEIYENANELKKEKKEYIPKKTVYQLIGCTNEELNAITNLLSKEEFDLLQMRKSNNYNLIMTKEEKDKFNNMLLPKLRMMVKENKEYKRDILKTKDEYINLCETIKKAKDNRDKELLSIIEKVIDTKMFKELNKVFSIKESIAIILINGYIYDSMYSADYVSRLLNIPLKRVFEIYKQSIVLLKYIRHEDIEKVKELTKN